LPDTLLNQTNWDYDMQAGAMAFPLVCVMLQTPTTLGGRTIMAAYISLISYTDQGIRNVKQSPERAQAFREAAEKAGATVKDIYWTLGSYDIVAITDVPDDETAMALLLATGSFGNVRTQTLKGFSAEEMKPIFAKIP
jgi:uncharacterized protein with GYD domain